MAWRLELAWMLWGGRGRSDFDRSGGGTKVGVLQNKESAGVVVGAVVVLGVFPVVESGHPEGGKKRDPGKVDLPGK